MKKQVLNEEFKRMQKLAGIIKENMATPINESISSEDIDMIIKNYGYEVSDMESLKNEMEYTDLIDAVAEKMENNTIGGASPESYSKAKQALLQYGKEKFNSSGLPIEGELVGDKFIVDFDDIGNLWHEKFEEKYGHEYDDLNYDDNDNFSTTQDEVIKRLEDQLSKMYGKPIKLEFEY